MSQGAHKTFTCPHCRKRFQWSTRIADRKAQCPACGKRIRIPTVPGRVAEAVDPLPESHKPKPQVEEDTYELDLTGIDENVVEPPPTPAQQAAAQTGRCPACNQSIKPGAVICIKCGYNLKRGKRLQTAVTDDDAPPELPASITGSALASLSTSPIAQALANREDEVKASKFIDLILPIGLILIGLAATPVLNWLLKGYLAFGIDWWLQALVSYPIQLVLMVPTLLLGAFFTASVMGAGFGSLTQGLLKMTAITMGPMAVADVLVGVLVPAAVVLSLTGIIAAAFMFFTIYIVFCAPFLFLLFDLEYTEVMVTTIAAVALRAFVLIFAALIVATVF